MSLCLTTLYTKNYSNFAPIAVRSFEKFCEKYDMNIVVYDSLLDDKKHPAWNKLLAIQECLFNHDYVFWCDIDSLYTGSEENFFSVDNFFHKHFIAHDDGDGLCTSHMLIKNKEYNKKLIDTLLFLGDVKDNNRFGNPYPKWEQNALKGLLDHFNLPIDFFSKKTIINYDQDDFDINTCFIHYHTIPSEEKEWRMKSDFKYFYC